MQQESTEQILQRNETRENGRTSAGASTDTNTLRLDRIGNEHALCADSGKGSSYPPSERVSDRDVDKEVDVDSMNTDSEDSSQAEGSSTQLLDNKLGNYNTCTKHTPMHKFTHNTQMHRVTYVL